MSVDVNDLAAAPTIYSGGVSKVGAPKRDPKKESELRFGLFQFIDRMEIIAKLTKTKLDDYFIGELSDILTDDVRWEKFIVALKS